MDQPELRSQEVPSPNPCPRDLAGLLEPLDGLHRQTATGDEQGQCGSSGANLAPVNGLRAALPGTKMRIGRYRGVTRPPVLAHLAKALNAAGREDQDRLAAQGTSPAGLVFPQEVAGCMAALHLHLLIALPGCRMRNEWRLNWSGFEPGPTSKGSLQRRRERGFDSLASRSA